MAKSPRLLLVADSDQSIAQSLATAVPGAQVRIANTWFDAIDELQTNPNFSAILAGAQPVERRPEVAVKTLREMAPQSRFILFGHPMLEPLSRKMLMFGADDYLVTPANPIEIQQLLAPPGPRAAAARLPIEPQPSDRAQHELTLATVILDALLNHPHDAPQQLVCAINDRISPDKTLHYVPKDGQPPQSRHATLLLSHPINEDSGTLYLSQPIDEDPSSARELLAEVTPHVTAVVALQERHNRLQKIAITDDLTNLYNGRYFRHFLARIIERAKVLRFPVTLLLFDIDNFKRYNDQFGHAAGDEILKQMGILMKRSCREHDLVARISGDEFAVIFWEKDPPRQPRDPQQVSGSRTPTTPLMMFNRFKRLLASHAFSFLGPQAQGSLTVSAGLAVYPFDAATPEELVKIADEQLMFGAKRGGKNSIHIVGPAD